MEEETKRKLRVGGFKIHHPHFGLWMSYREGEAEIRVACIFCELWVAWY